MSRLKRYFEEGSAYFVTTVTKNRKPIFCDPKLCKQFLITVEYYKVFFEYEVLAYCLMPDHVHLLIRPSSKYPLPFLMRMIKGSFARKLNKISDREGHVWQRRYYDEAVRTDSQLLHQITYVHMNPVAAGMVETPDQYKFSSYQQYYGHPGASEMILEINKPE